MKIKVSVPATSANVGSGFDALGLAVTLYNTVTFEDSEVLEISASDGTRIPRGESNLVYRSAKGLFEKVGKQIPPLKITQTNPIPMARGLGSSSACIIAGLLANLFEQALGRAIDQIALAPGDTGAVRRRDVQMVALFKCHRVVQRHREAQCIEAGADVGAGRRDGNFDLHSSSLSSSAQTSSGRRRSTSFTLPPTASTFRAASARALPSALSTK